MYFPFGSYKYLYILYISCFDIVEKLLTDYHNADFLVLGGFNLPLAAFCDTNLIFFNNLLFLINN